MHRESWTWVLGPKFLVRGIGQSPYLSPLTLTAAPVPGQMVAGKALALEGARRIGTQAIVTHVSRVTLIHICRTQGRSGFWVPRISTAKSPCSPGTRLPSDMCVSGQMLPETLV